MGIVGELAAPPLRANVRFGLREHAMQRQLFGSLGGERSTRRLLVALSVLLSRFIKGGFSGNRV